MCSCLLTDHYFINTIILKLSLPQVSDVILDGANASVSSLAFCSLNLTIAVGTTSGLVSSYC